jgi:membrane-bound lytic murein transglycosylase F
VAEGKYDFTVADSHILDSELAWRNDVRTVFTLNDTAKLGWAMRAVDTKLKAAVDAFVAREYRGLFYNVTRDKYFGVRKTGDMRGRLRLEPGTQLSPYDDLVRKYADQYDFDWRLVTAQMYRESRFNPKARSFAGAFGLMQLMPRTAQSLGIRKPEQPEGSIHAGVKYLASLRDRLPRELPVADRVWFALASYNAGHGHVIDARTLARQKGLNPDRWFGHTEQGMLLLSRPEYAARARHGYVRGSEPVQYVREIRDYHQAYVQAGF